MYFVSCCIGFLLVTTCYSDVEQISGVALCQYGCAWCNCDTIGDGCVLLQKRQRWEKPQHPKLVSIAVISVFVWFYLSSTTDRESPKLLPVPKIYTYK